MMKLHNTIILAIITMALALSSAQAQFLDFSRPARATALGGNLPVLSDGPSALAFNPAGLALQERFEATARYEGLFAGIEGDDLSTGNITLISTPFEFGAFGASWDHLAANLLQQDRFRLAWGKSLASGGIVHETAVGLSLTYLTQSFVLSGPLTVVSPSQLSSSAFSFGGGVLVAFNPDLSVGFSVEDINRPNVGVVSVDRLPVFMRWGLAAKVLPHGPVQLTLTAAQSFADSRLETQGGAECFFPQYGVRLRAGANPYQAAVGFGYEMTDFFIDYSYSFSAFANNQLSGTGVPGSHLLEMGVKWGVTASAAVYAEYMRKAGEAEAQGRWDKANWYYLECFSIKPEKAAIDGHNRVLANFNRERAERCYKDGQEARKKGFLLEARNDTELAVKLAPQNRDYSNALAQITEELARMTSDEEIVESIQQVSRRVAKDDKEGALRIVTQALEKHPRQPALELVKRSLEGETEVADAPVSTTAAKEAKQAAKLVTTEADLYLSRGRADLAKENLQKALETNPQSAEIKRKLAKLEAPVAVISPEKVKLGQELYEKGLQKYLEGDLNGAIHDWEEALKADPTNTRVQNNLVRAKIEEKMEHP
jgi:tetratricopeptide (TPR) repeat protein